MKLRLQMLPNFPQMTDTKFVFNWQALFANTRTALTGKLVVVVEKAGEWFLLDTDIPVDVPPVVRKRAELVADTLSRGLP